jgi:hypothetical protein
MLLPFLVGATYAPASGDHVEVIRRQFKPGHLAKARPMILKTLSQELHRDGLVRMHVYAENEATGEMVALIFSDPYNRGNWGHREKFGHVRKVPGSAVLRHDFRLFAVHDEEVPIVKGDTLKLYWHKVKPHAHNDLKSALAQRMIKALREDEYRTNAYMGESEDAGQVLGIGIGQFHPRNGRYNPTIRHLNEHRERPIQRGTYRVVWVRKETAK